MDRVVAFLRRQVVPMAAVVPAVPTVAVVPAAAQEFIPPVAAPLVALTLPVILRQVSLLTPSQKAVSLVATVLSVRVVKVNQTKDLDVRNLNRRLSPIVQSVRAVIVNQTKDLNVRNLNRRLSPIAQSVKVLGITLTIRSCLLYTSDAADE